MCTHLYRLLLIKEKNGTATSFCAAFRSYRVLKLRNTLKLLWMD